MPENARIPFIPPVIPLVTLGVAAIGQYFFPIYFPESSLLRFAGLFLILASLAIVGLAIRKMMMAQTSFDVRKPSVRLVTDGIFSLTRNPTYLAMQVLLLGFALMFESPILLVLLIPAGLALYLLVIRREEIYLAEVFGESYAGYKRTVRRWI